MIAILKDLAGGSGLQRILRSLYFGDDTRARRFRYGMVWFDLTTIGVFILSASFPGQWWIVPLDFALGTILLIELSARLYAETDRRRQAMSLSTATDIVVIASLFLPTFIENLGFLRIFRALRLFRSFQLLRDLRSDSDWFRRYEDVIQRTLNQLVVGSIPTSPDLTGSFCTKRFERN